MKNWVAKNSLYISLAVSLAATIGSLFFSEVLHYTPCVLCWYQRIFMYPLVIISLVAILNKDVGARRYILSLALIGALIGLYQNLLVWKILSEKLAPCVNGVSCVTQPVVWFGFITIPLLSLLASVTIVTVTLITNTQYSCNKNIK